VDLKARCLSRLTKSFVPGQQEHSPFLRDDKSGQVPTACTWVSAGQFKQAPDARPVQFHLDQAELPNCLSQLCAEFLEDKVRSQEIEGQAERVLYQARTLQVYPDCCICHSALTFASRGGHRLSACSRPH